MLGCAPGTPHTEEALLLVRLHSEACSARPLKALRFRVAEAPRLHAARVSAHTPHVLALHLPLSQVGSGVGVCALHCVATSATCLVERSSGTGSQSSLPEANKNASLNRHWQLCSCAAVTPERAQAEAPVHCSAPRRCCGRPKRTRRPSPADWGRIRSRHPEIRDPRTRSRSGCL